MVSLLWSLERVGHKFRFPLTMPVFFPFFFLFFGGGARDKD